MTEADLRITDPRGVEVFCSGFDLQWFLYGKHTEVIGIVTRDHIIQAISQPRDGFIYLSKSYENCLIYYNKFHRRKPELMVVVSFEKGNPGQIKTIHLVKKRSPGEKIQWPALEV